MPASTAEPTAMARPSDKLTTEELEERWTDPVATAHIAKSCECVAYSGSGVCHIGRARRSSVFPPTSVKG